MRNAGLDESQAGIRIARRNVNNLRYADDTCLMAETEEEVKNPFNEGERDVKQITIQVPCMKQGLKAGALGKSWGMGWASGWVHGTAPHVSDPSCTEVSL